MTKTLVGGRLAPWRKAAEPSFRGPLRRNRGVESGSTARRGCLAKFRPSDRQRMSRRDKLIFFSTGAPMSPFPTTPAWRYVSSQEDRQILSTRVWLLSALRLNLSIFPFKRTRRYRIRSGLGNRRRDNAKISCSLYTRYACLVYGSVNKIVWCSEYRRYSSITPIGIQLSAK